MELKEKNRKSLQILETLEDWYYIDSDFSREIENGNITPLSFSSSSSTTSQKTEVRNDLTFFSCIFIMRISF